MSLPRSPIARARAAVLALALVVAALATPVWADRGGFDIARFDVELSVEESSDLVVTERLEVDFHEPRHGIYRTIPVRYTDPRGYQYSLGVRMLGVTDGDGVRVDAKVTDEGRYRKIRIGDPERTVEGRVVYVLRYRVRDALGHFAEHDELYWNATGHEWNAEIGSSSATVRLPGTPPPEVLEAAGYTGSFGSREQEVEVVRAEPGVVGFEPRRSFAPLEGLTVVVAWPHGYVRFPGKAARVGRFLADNWALLMPFAWLGLLWRRYRQRGRDPEPTGPVMVHYEAPPGLTPAEVGAVIDETVDLRDITATVVDLAVRGFLTIRLETRDRLFGLLEKEETVFVRDPGADTSGLAQHERLVLVALFESGDEVDTGDLENKFYRQIPKIDQAVYRRLVERGHFDASPSSVRSRWMVYAFLAAFATGLSALAWLKLRGAIFPNAAAVPVVAAALTLAVFAAFSRAMPRRTAAGVAVRRWALGFQEFAGRVEGDRLEQVDPRQLFETLLPHAMALGVAAQWAKRFEGIYADRQPGWCTGASSPGPSFSTRSFERGLASAMSRAGSSMATAPRSSGSSGSGGGGSSGGGGGGGGGGSW